MNRTAFVTVFAFLSAELAAQPRRDTMPAAPRAERILLRSLAGYGGGIPLMIAGGSIGYYHERTHYPGNSGDDPGLTGMILGGTLGLVAGSALVGALPALGTGCSYGKRLTRSLAGTVGTVAISVLSIAAGGSAGIVVVLAAPVGGALAQGRC